MHQGGTFLIRIRLAAGSNRGWVPLMISFPGQVNISVARKDMNQTLEVSTPCNLSPIDTCKLFSGIFFMFWTLIRASLILCS